MNRHEFASPINPEITEVVSPKVTAELVKTGALVPLDKIGAIWHGRAGEAGEEWQISPFFVPPSRSNVYDNTFYATPHRQDAKDFARARSGSIKHPQITELEPTRANLFVINNNAEPHLAKQLAISLTEGIPVTSELDSLAAQTVSRSIKEAVRPKRLAVTREDIEEFAHSTLPTGADPEQWQASIEKYCKAHNSGVLISNGNLVHAARAAMGRTEPKLLVGEENGQKVFEFIPLSKEYILETFRRAGIVGEQSDFTSGTLGRSIKDTLAIWDLSALQTKKTNGERRQSDEALMRPLSRYLEEFNQPTLKQTEFDRLRNLVQDPFSAPDTIIAEGRKIPDLAQLLDKPAGVWEGYTIGEHTEATLQIFERYFADKVPAQLLGFIKTALLVHDIGKGVAVENRDQAHQAAFNEKYAALILDRMGYSGDAKKALLLLIGPAAKYYSDVSRFDANRVGLAATVEQISELMRDDQTTNSSRFIMTISRLLYTCDAGAYTKMARYTKAVNGGGRVVMRTLESLDHVFQIGNDGTPVMEQRTQK